MFTIRILNAQRLALMSSLQQIIKDYHIEEWNSEDDPKCLLEASLKSTEIRNHKRLRCLIATTRHSQAIPVGRPFLLSSPLAKS